MSNENWPFVMCRSFPLDVWERPPLVSALQSFETSLLLVALGRYPSALIACVAAWESTIRAFFKLPTTLERKFSTLLRDLDAKGGGEILKFLKKSKTKDYGLCDYALQLRETRNRFVHSGSVPDDSIKSITLLLTVGFPGFFAILRFCFGAYPSFEDLTPKPRDFSSLTPAASRKVFLVPYIASPLRLAIEAAGSLTEVLTTDEALLLLKPLSLKIGEMFKDAFLLNSEIRNMEHGFQHSEGLWKEVEELKLSLDGPNFAFDCPFCNKLGSLVVEFNLEEASVINLGKGICAECETVIDHKKSRLMRVFLKSQIKQKRDEILAEEKRWI